MLVGAGYIYNLSAAEFKTPDWQCGGAIKIPCLLEPSFVVRTKGDKTSMGGSVFLSLWNKKIPVDVKTGHLQYTGAVSLLNNPLLSTNISPFSVPANQVSQVSSKLPDGSSWNKPVSIYGETGYQSKTGLLRKALVNGFAGLDEYAGSSFCVRLKTVNGLGIDFLGVTASSSVQQKTNSSWYYENPLYKNDYGIPGFLFQTALSRKKLSFVFSDIIFVSPFGQVKQMFRCENRLGNFSFSVFYNPSHNTETVSQKSFDELLQIKTGLYGESRTGNTVPVFWKYGASALVQFNLAEKEDQLKIAAGFRFLCYLTSASFTLQGDFHTRPDENTSFMVIMKKASVSCKNAWYFRYVQPVFRSSFSINPSDDYSCWNTEEKFDVSCSLLKKPSIYFSTGVTLDQQNNVFKKGSTDFGLSVKYKIGWFDVSGKISVSIEF